MKEKRTKEIAMCGNCGSFNIEYVPLRIDGAHVISEFSCLDCGCKGKEVYLLSYSHTVTYIEK